MQTASQAQASLFSLFLIATCCYVAVPWPILGQGGGDNCYCYYNDYCYLFKFQPEAY